MKRELYIEDIKKLTDTEINRIIHRFRGYCWCPDYTKETESAVVCKRCGAGVLKRKWCGWELPNYCQDLNELAAAEAFYHKDSLKKKINLVYMVSDAIIFETEKEKGKADEYMKVMIREARMFSRLEMVAHMMYAPARIRAEALALEILKLKK